MGQLNLNQCTSKRNDSDQIHRLSLTLSRCASIIEPRTTSFSETHQLGQYLQIGKNKQLEEDWDKLFQDLDKNQHSILKSNYDNHLNQDPFQIVHAECPLIATKDDFHMLVLYYEDKFKFHNFGLRGIPQRYRWSFWKILTLYEEIQCQRQKEEQQSFINKQQFQQFQETDSTYSINKDINRTLIHKFFTQEVGMDRLGTILNAIANVNPKLGYCQGMNYVVALLVMVSGGNEGKQYETFLVFNQLINSPYYMMNLLYANQLPLLVMLEELIVEFMKIKTKLIHKHFVKEEVPNSFWLTKILLSGFVYSFEVRECVILWDYILMRGTVKGFIELVLALLQTCEKQLLSLDQLGISEFFSCTDGKKAEPIIRKALENGFIPAKKIRKLSKKSKSSLKPLMMNFEEQQFDEIYKNISSF